jgi:uncharacterized protein YdcH (DUF465 family)
MADKPSGPLAAEFPGLEGEIDRLKNANPRFEAIANRLRELHRDITHHERQIADEREDDRLKALKVERLGLLDEMALILRGGEKAPSQARKDGRE